MTAEIGSVEVLIVVHRYNDDRTALMIEHRFSSRMFIKQGHIVGAIDVLPSSITTLFPPCQLPGLSSFFCTRAVVTALNLSIFLTWS